MSTSPDLLAQLFRLDGQVAIVTGGMGRLGSQYVRTLVAAGASVAIFDLPGRSHADVDRLIEDGQPVASYPVDAVDRAAVDRAIRSLTARFGAATVLVNNAGLGSSPADAALETGPFETYPEAAWDAMLDSHLKSALVVSQSFIAQFKAARRHDAALTGSIINVSSTYGLVSPDRSVYEYRRRDGAEYYKPVGYSVAKSGVLNFTRWLAEYGAPIRPPGQHARAGRCARARSRAGIPRRLRTADAARPNGEGGRLQRRGPVPGVPSLRVHDRRDAGRRRRLDYALNH